MPDIGDDDLNQRLFGPAPDQPLELPGVRGRDRFRGIAQQDAPGSVEALAAMPPLRLSPADRARADALVQRLATLLRNTNITASLPAHSEPGLWSDPIDLSASYSLPAAVGAYTTVLSFAVPSGRWARIDAYGFDVGGGFTYDGSILWRLQVNGVNVPGLQPWGEHRGSLVQPRKTFFLVPQSQTVTFQVKRAVAAGSPSTVTMALLGWMWRLRRNDEGTKASITAF
jgi:hypothetical protein